MSEIMGDKNGNVQQDLISLYKLWAEGGAGLLITGNVMVDSNAKGEPGNIIIEDESDIEGLKQWANVGKTNDTHIWVQLNHPGKQSPKSVSQTPVAPSAIPLSGGLNKVFNPPRALEIEEIKEIIQKFIRSAEICKKAGFTGVQIHAAHGYLINQFLSPKDNQRTDEYGGSLENRMRFLIEIYQGMRANLGSDFPIGVKLNSSDFTREGFSEEDSLFVIKTLSDLGIDLIEISGGNYSSTKMMRTDNNEEEEVIFKDFSTKVKEQISSPILLTGGFRAEKTMVKAIEENITDFIGIARPLALIPDLVNQIEKQQYKTLYIQRMTTGFKKLDRLVGPLVGIAYYEQQMKRLAKGKQVSIHKNAWSPLFFALRHHGKEVFKPKRR